MTIALTLAHLSRQAVLDDGFGGHGGANLDLSDFDQLSLPRAPLVLQRGEQRHSGMHTGYRVGGTLQIARRPIRISGDRRHAGQLFDIQGPADEVAPGSLQSESGHPDHDHIGIDRDERVVVQSELLHDTRREVFDDHVGLRGKTQCQLATCLRRQVKGDVALVQVGPLPQRAAFVPIVAVAEQGTRVAMPIRTLNGLDLDDVGPEGAQVAGEIGARPEGAEVEYLQARERAGGVVCSGSIGCCRELIPAVSSTISQVRRRRWSGRGGLRQPKRCSWAAKGLSSDLRFEEEPALAVLWRRQDRGSVVDRGRGDAHRLAELHQVGNIHRVEPWLRLGEELVALGPAEHDRELVLAVFG